MRKDILATAFLSALFLLAALLPGCVLYEENTSENGLLKVVVSVNNGSGVISKTVFVKKGSTAFDAFNAAAVLNYSIHPAYGVFVTGINGVQQDEKAGLYWQYYVDGQLAPVGVSSFKIEKNVSLEFRLEKPYEFT